MLGIGRLRSEWLRDHIENPDAIYFQTMICVRTPSEQAAEIREQAKKAGIAMCALADSIDHSSVGALSP